MYCPLLTGTPCLTGQANHSPEHLIQWNTQEGKGNIDGRKYKIKNETIRALHGVTTITKKRVKSLPLSQVITISSLSQSLAETRTLPPVSVRRES